MVRVLSLSSILLVMTFSSAVQGQGVELEFERHYGRGVHHFFSGHIPEAHQSFSRAIETEFPDPRPYYFRGLSLIRLGHSGQPDFDRGARIEILGGGSSRLVNRALERIQGEERLQIEKTRAAVRRQHAGGELAGLTIIDIQLGGESKDSLDAVREPGVAAPVQIREIPADGGR